MTLRVCEECSARFAPGVTACPGCGSTDHHEQTEEDDMPKISRADGPTYKGILEPEHVEDQEELERESAKATETDEEREQREERIERSEGPDTLTGDGTGETLPPFEPVEERHPVGEHGSEPLVPTKSTKATKAKAQ